jgi:hypothetical protein
VSSGELLLQAPTGAQLLLCSLLTPELVKGWLDGRYGVRH